MCREAWAPDVRRRRRGQRAPSACSSLHRKVGFPSCPPAPQVLKELYLAALPASLGRLVPTLRTFPRLKRLTLEGQMEQGFALPTAVLRHLPALESLDVREFGSMALSEPLPRLTSLTIGRAYRVEVGAGAALPSLRSLDSYDIGTVVLRCSLPQLTRLGIRRDRLHAATQVGTLMLAARYC